MRRRLKTIETGVAGAIRGKAVCRSQHTAHCAHAALSPPGLGLSRCRATRGAGESHDSYRVLYYIHERAPQLAGPGASLRFALRGLAQKEVSLDSPSHALEQQNSNRQTALPYALMDMCRALWCVIRVCPISSYKSDT